MIWIEPRSSIVGQMVKLFFGAFLEKWLFGIKMDKMATRGRSPMHFQKASKLSKRWGPLQISHNLLDMDIGIRCLSKTFQ